MKTSILLSFIAVAYVVAKAPPITQPVLGIDPYTGLNLPADPFGASVLSLLYGSPLLIFAFKLSNGTLAKFGVNKYRSGSSLNGAGSEAGSNVDTIYGQAFIDLAAQDLLLTVPPMQSDRYYSFSFYDVWSDDFYVLGSLNNDTGGQYYIRPALKTGSVGLTTKNCAGYTGCIDSPVLNPFFLVRVLVKYPDNQTDLDYVNNYVKSVKLQIVNNHTATAPPLKQADVDNLGSDNITRALQLTARFYERNPPQTTLLATFYTFALLAAGISDGSYTPVPSVNLSKVSQAQIDIVNAFTSNPQNLISLPPNGWTIGAPRWDGSFEQGKNLVARSYLGIGRIGNPAEQALYVVTPQPLYTLAAKGEAYILQFSGKVPINSRVGFWSLTMYDSRFAFVDNPQKIFALGDRSSLQYPDGTPVYRGGNATRDGPFKILIQPYDQTPPANWTNNWLPSPTGGVPFQVLLRIYAPTPDASNGQYDYPTFTKVSALTRK